MQVEALRDNLQQVGAQKVLHEQQAEMWKQKHAAMEKLVDHLELLVTSQQKQLMLVDHQRPPSRAHLASPQGGVAAGSRETETPEREPPERASDFLGAVSDPDHVQQRDSPSQQQRAAGVSRPIPTGISMRDCLEVKSRVKISMKKMRK